ncbi:glycosyltransferase family 2 protein [Rhodocytophaga rosea]|uniref:Glycosyltransferase family 2 protein n=1 Tax=Rhodocytophaga rosea TaxID=2704465 RepID=A0A6C0GNT8_9BACT|nr:glycosyltransferase family 2 protein [Rhodocytophaga rosea]QHT69597.1 glycosyltransferase family 2 protein [Rhodocytophaga rosea]
MPKVTVIIPSYNHASYLDKRIRSVLDQTYQDFNLIIIDDYSRDNSRDIIALYAQQDKRIEVVFNEQNSGSTFYQWNKGVEMGKGEFIWIAESDDMADPVLLETLVGRLERYPTAGIAYCQSWIVDEQDTVLHSGINWVERSVRERWKTDFFNTGPEECSKYLILHNMIFNASAVVFRKAMYLKAGPADSSLKLTGDWLQWVKILLISDVVYVAQPLNYFRKHTQTTRHVSYMDLKELAEFYQVLQFIAVQVPIDPVSLKNSSLGSRWELAFQSPLTMRAFRNLLRVWKMGRNIDPLLTKRIIRFFIDKLSGRG